MEKDNQNLYVAVDLRFLRNRAKEVGLVYDQKWFVCLSYEDGIPEESEKEDVVSSIDPGEIHTIASVTEKGDSLVITGRYMRSLHRLRNRKLGEIATIHESLQKRGRESGENIIVLNDICLSKSEAQLKDALHKTTKQFVEWCLAARRKPCCAGESRRSATKY